MAGLLNFQKANQGRKATDERPAGLSSPLPAFPAVCANRPQASPALELVSWTWGTSDSEDFVEAKGEVRNISGESLDRIEAVVTWKTSDGTLIKSESTLIEYQPILPGQTSPFHVLATRNPAMKKAGIDFKTLGGGTVVWKKKESK